MRGAFDITEKGLRFQAWYPDSGGEATVKISKGDEIIKEFTFPAYKIWNIAAHASDIADDIQSGLAIAASNGLGGSVPIRDVPDEDDG